ncbi:MAG: Rrf2 family transcriptional regulator [Bacteroidetes bacterium]|nr:Rrf2 family transcriptional regulator [Bacteroidota bacterium]
MKFSTKTRYGMRAMVEIAKVDQQKGILQKDISKNQKISIKYLDQIILALKTADLIVNIKGKKSGYRLTRNASEITALDIHYAFEPEIAVIDCMSGKVKCQREEICYTNSFWASLNQVVIDYFADATLEDLVNKRQF